MSKEKEVNQKPKKSDVFVKGLNWGNLKTTENELIFSHKSKSWFNMPMSSISNIQHISNKNEIALEINQEDANDDTALCEIRLFVPEQEVKNKKNNKNSEENESAIEENKSEDNKSEENIEINEEENESNENNKRKRNLKSRAEMIKDDIIKKAKIGSVSNSIAHIQDIQMITPRGKFDLYFTKNYLKIHGLSFNYQIFNKNILKVFLLPKNDNHNHFFVLKLKTPLTQGNTQYPLIIFQILSDEEVNINLNITEKDEELKKNFPNIEDNSVEGKLMDIIAKLFNSLTNVGVIIPSKNFTFNTGPYIKCSYRVNDGILYPLEKCLLFVHKPVLYIVHKDIKNINFERLHESSGQQRTFDMIVKTNKDSFKFVGVDKNEMELLKKYFDGKKIKLNVVDENYNNIDINNYTANTRRRAQVDEEVPELPSDEDLISGDDYSDDSSSEEFENDDDEEEVSKKEKSKTKGKGKEKESGNTKGKKNSKKKGNNNKNNNNKKPKLK